MGCYNLNTESSPQPDVLNAQFSHMTLGQQPPNDSGASAQDSRHYPTVYHHHHHHPSPVVLQGAPPQQVASYMVTGPSGGHPGVLQSQPVPLPTPGPNHAYPSSTPGPAAFPGSTLNQPLLQQHTYIQQPVQQVAAPGNVLNHHRESNVQNSHWICVLPQMSTCYCSSAHHPHCSTQQQQQQQQQPQQHYRPPVNPLQPYNCPQSQNLPQQQGLF